MRYIIFLSRSIMIIVVFLLGMISLYMHASVDLVSL